MNRIFAILLIIVMTAAVIVTAGLTFLLLHPSSNGVVQLVGIGKVIVPASFAVSIWSIGKLIITRVTDLILSSAN